jgi:hypothetical protein
MSSKEAIVEFLLFAIPALLCLIHRSPEGVK